MHLNLFPESCLSPDKAYYGHMESSCTSPQAANLYLRAYNSLRYKIYHHITMPRLRKFRTYRPLLSTLLHNPFPQKSALTVYKAVD